MTSLTLVHSVIADMLSLAMVYSVLAFSIVASNFCYYPFRASLRVILCFTKSFDWAFEHGMGGGAYFS